MLKRMLKLNIKPLGKHRMNQFYFVSEKEVCLLKLFFIILIYNN
jgi:hypothetical protein